MRRWKKPRKVFFLGRHYVEIKPKALNLCLGASGMGGEDVLSSESLGTVGEREMDKHRLGEILLYVTLLTIMRVGVA